MRCGLVDEFNIPFFVASFPKYCFPDFAHLYTITTYNPYSYQQKRQNQLDPA
jgi:hypothetical protein